MIVASLTLIVPSPSRSQILRSSVSRAGTPEIPTTPQPTTVQPTTAPERLRGDVDGDGEVTVMDSTYLQKSIVGISGVPAVEL